MLYVSDPFLFLLTAGIIRHQAVMRVLLKVDYSFKWFAVCIFELLAWTAIYSYSVKP